MSTNQSSFQDRLKKIEQKQAEPRNEAEMAQIAAAAAAAKQVPEFGGTATKESPIGTGHLMIAGGVVGVLALGAVLFRDVMAPPDDITAAVMADGGPREVSLLGRMFGGSFDPQSVQAQLPVYHLPSAGEGWVRATRKDARKAFALDKLREQWPEGSGSTYVTLDENPGFRGLSKFVQLSQVKTTKTENLAKTQAEAYYLSTEGAHLKVTIRFLPDEQRLGPEGATETWANRMVTDRIGFKGGGAPMVGELGGRPIAVRGVPSLDPEDTLPNRIDIGVPLTSNVIMHVAGHASPADVHKLVSDVNVQGLLAFAG